jgi:hypothetical protein
MAQILWLADVLRAAGVQVVEEGDWRARGVSGAFEPIGVLWHHTAATSSPSNPAPALNLVIEGRPDLEGPLCHALVDYHGVFHLISANRANHAGDSGGSGPIPAGDGNRMLIGWEIDYAGDQETGPDQAMTAAQYNASVAATGAVLRHLGRDAGYARGHRETSVTGKIDPSFVDLNVMRADVARWLAGGSTPSPTGRAFHNLRYAAGNWSGANLADDNPGIMAAAGAGMPNNDMHLLTLAGGRVYHNLRSANGSWTGANVADDNGGISALSAAGTGTGDMHLVTLVGGRVYHNLRGTNGSWTGANLADDNGGISALSAAGTGSGELHLLTLVGGRVYHNLRRPNGTWTGANLADDNGGISALSAAGTGTGDMHLVTLVGGKAYHNLRRPNGTWTGGNLADDNGGIFKVAAAGTGNGDMHLITLVP